MNEFEFLHNSFDLKHRPNKSEVPDIFLVEDDKDLGFILKNFLEKKNLFKVYFFECPSDCIEFLDKRENNLKPFCLITDISFSNNKIDGLSLIDFFKEKKIQLCFNCYDGICFYYHSN